MRVTVHEYHILGACVYYSFGYCMLVSNTRVEFWRHTHIFMNMLLHACVIMAHTIVRQKVGGNIGLVGGNIGFSVMLTQYKFCTQPLLRLADLK